MITIKTQKLAEWIKSIPQLDAVYKTFTSKYKNVDKLKAKRWRNIYHTTFNHKKLGVAILVSDKIRLQRILLDKKMDMT